MSTIIVKVGGEIFTSGVLGAVTADVAALVRAGSRVVMIHGGGPQATAMQRALGQTPAIVAGRRITDEATLEVVKMVVGGQLNIDLCAALLAAGARPVGLHGASSLLIEGRKQPPRMVNGSPEPIDYGLVGDVVGVNRALIQLLLDTGYTPVLACLAADERGVVLNINADAVACQVATVLAADHLVLVTGTSGVLARTEDPDSRIPRLTMAEARAAIAGGTVSGGMVAKLEEAMEVLAAGCVGSVHIVGALGPGDLVRVIEQPGAIGTVLVS